MISLRKSKINYLREKHKKIISIKNIHITNDRTIINIHKIKKEIVPTVDDICRRKLRYCKI